MASCILPDCVRWASSMKTKRFPLALKLAGQLGLELLDELGVGLIPVVSPRWSCCGTYGLANRSTMGVSLGLELDKLGHCR